MQSKLCYLQIQSTLQKLGVQAETVKNLPCTGPKMDHTYFKSAKPRVMPGIQER